MNELTQLIDYNGSFVGAVAEWMKENGCMDAGFDYSVVAILGCQSSGKSSLLNAMFGTTFQVMDATAGRTQTTKGLWLGKDQKGLPGKPTLIVDVEGTDSRERGEDRLTFEHRAALFSLAVADCLIVNMWYNDIGRYTASNYGLLKTVMEVNLDLFHNEREEDDDGDSSSADPPKTVLLFVIRDFSTKVTPLEKLESMILDDIRTIWSQMRKPDRFRDSSADKFFDFKTIGLGSLLLDEQNFKKDVESMRTLYNSVRPAQFTRNVPADGFGYYCQSIWITIIKEASLDIPSQKEMLATFRCEEIKASVLSVHAIEIQAKLSMAQRGELNEFSCWASGVVEVALREYHVQAFRYEETISKRKGHELFQCLCVELQKIVDAILLNLRQQHLQMAHTKLELQYRSDTKADETIQGWEKFKATTDAWQEDSLEEFFDATKGLVLKEKYVPDFLFNTDVAREALAESLESWKERIRSAQINELSKMIKKSIASDLGDKLDNIESVFAQSSFDGTSFWKSMSTMVQDASTLVEGQLASAWTGLTTKVTRGPELSPTGSLSPVSVLDVGEENFVTVVAQIVYRQMLGKMREVTKYVHHHIKARFTAYFINDEEGIPRQWQTMSAETIRTSYLKARDQALEIIEVLKIMNLDATGYLSEVNIAPPEPYVLLTDEAASAAEQRATKAMQESCKEALAIQASGSAKTNIPMWMYLLLAALGYNEVALVLTSPFFLFLSLVTAVVLGVSYMTGNIRMPFQLARQSLTIASTFTLPILQKLQDISQDASGSGEYNTPSVVTSEEPSTRRRHK